MKHAFFKMIFMNMMKEQMEAREEAMEESEGHDEDEGEKVGVCWSLL